MTTTTKTDEQAYVVRIDHDGKPIMREYAYAASEDAALAAMQEHCDDDEVAAEAVLLQPILDAISERVAQGVKYAVIFKHEHEDERGRAFGPVWITDLDAMRAEAEKQGAVRENGTVVLAVPFGHVPDYETPLPWMAKPDARRLAKYLRVPFGEG